MTPPYVARDDEGVIAVADNDRFGDLDRFAMGYLLRTGKIVQVNQISEEDATRLRKELVGKLQTK